MDPHRHAMNEVAQMLQDIRDETALTQPYTGLASLPDSVMEAIASVPREVFLPPAISWRAFLNGPAPIGHGQTISQPFIVALMTTLLNPGPNDIVLEIGTGSGYQAAVLAGLVKQIYSMEIIGELADKALSRLALLGFDNIEVHIGDGYSGWPEQAPYDGIIVTAAAPHIPVALIQQLKPGAKLVIPVGPDGGAQTLQVVDKDTLGKIQIRNVLPVAFVPLTRQ